MSSPIRIRYRWDRENVERLFGSSYRYLFEHSFRRYIGWLFIILSQFGVVAAFKQGAFGLLIFSTLLLLYWYYGKRVIAKRRLLKSYSSSPFKDQEISIEASDSGLAIHALGTTVHWDWEDIDELISIGDDLLLHKAPHFYYIPASGFVSLEQKSRFKSLAKQHGRLQ